MAKAESSEIAILPTAMTERHDQAVEQHAADRRAAELAGAGAQRLRVVLDAVGRRAAAASAPCTISLSVWVEATKAT